MPQTKLYIDTNAYLRLALPLHPLLFRPFCPNKYTIYITHRFQNEFDRQPRLRKSFSWVNEPEYRANRTQQISIPNKNKEDIKLAIGYIRDEGINRGLGVQDVDIDILAHGYVLEIPIITDDSEMTTLGRTFQIQLWSSLDLMEWMLKCGAATQEQLDGVITYIDKFNDLPWGSYIADYAKRFHNTSHS